MSKINYKPIVSLFCLVFLFCSCNALTVIGYLKGDQSFKLFIGENMYSFVNETKNDTTIKIDIPIKRITEVRYGISFNGGSKIRHTMLLSPTDTIAFKKEDHDLIPMYKQHENVFVDKMMDAGFYSLFDSFNSTRVFSKDEINMILTYELNKSRLDSLKIDSLFRRGGLSGAEKYNLIQFRKLTCAVKLFRLSENEKNFQNLPEFYDKLFDQVLSDPGYQLIDGDLRENLFYYLGTYWLKKNSGQNKNLINFYLEHKGKLAPDYISGYFLNYLRTTNQRDNNKIAFKANETKIIQYAKGYDRLLYGEILKLQKRKIFDMAQLTLLDSKNNMLNLKKVVEATGKKYIFLDFWASWCVPCRQQIPELKESKKLFKNNDIAFIGISSDDNNADWKRALSQEQLDSDKLQFILLKGSKPPISTTFFDIRTIPRYIIIDNKGNVINSRFYLPADVRFRTEIQNLLNSNLLAN